MPENVPPAADRDLIAACERLAIESRAATGLPAKITDPSTYRRVGYLFQRAEASLTDEVA